MQGLDRLKDIGNLLGAAKADLETGDFVVLLAFANEFTRQMLLLETAGMDKQGVEDIKECAKNGVIAHLRAMGIEVTG